MNRNIKTIFIDWNKTLSNSFFWQQFMDEKHDLHYLDRKIYKWLFVDNKELINSWMLGKLNSEEICKKIGDGIGYDYNKLLKELIISCQNMKFIDEDIKYLIEKIRKKGIKCVIATDNMDCFTKYTVPALSLDKIFDDILNSSEIGFFKYSILNGVIPFFDKYLQNSKLDYSEVILIDDSIEKSGFFEKIGFDIINIKSPQELLNALMKYAN